MTVDRHSILMQFEKRYFALAAITASPAALAQMISAGVFGAEDTYIAGRFAADGACKRSYFHSSW